MTDEHIDDLDDERGASAPEPSLVTRQVAAAFGATTEAPGPDGPPSIDRVDAEAATQGRVDEAATTGEQAATTDDLGGDLAPDRLKEQGPRV
jgi:hypothetical protein